MLRISASCRVVFPASFGPVTSVNPGPNAKGPTSRPKPPISSRSIHIENRAVPSHRVQPGFECELDDFALAAVLLMVSTLDERGDEPAVGCRLLRKRLKIPRPSS